MSSLPVNKIICGDAQRFSKDFLTKTLIAALSACRIFISEISDLKQM
jgi:hypothetical protein